MDIYQSCDIRGVADQDLTDETVRRIGRVIGIRLAGHKVITGGDMRLSTPRLLGLINEALVSSGCQVFCIGITATPVLYYAQKYYGATGGVMVTASHNPGEYNGFKLILGSMPITEAEIAEIAAAVARQEQVDGTGSLTYVDIQPEYIAERSRQSSRGRLKIVVDAGNGAMSLLAPKVFRNGGYEVLPLFCEPDGTFPNRSPNPALAQNLKALGEEVRRYGADLGVAFDGDGDRAGFVDEQGRPIENDRILALLAQSYLEQEQGTVIYDAKCSLAVREVIEQAGGRAIMARAGHTFSKAAFLKENAVFAGEISGHFFFREIGQDDGLFAGLKVAELCGQKGPLSALAATIPVYPITPDIRIPYVGDKGGLVEAVAQQLSGRPLNRIDGIRLEQKDGWAMIRPSVTEPLLTFRFEGRTQTALQEIAQELLAAVPDQVRLAVEAEWARLLPKV